MRNLALSRDTIEKYALVRRCETICQQIVLDRISAIAEPIEGLCYIVYADAGNRTRTYRVTVQDDPTTPQRHTFRKAGITTIYDTNRFVTSADKEESSIHNINYIVPQEK
jgi:hypothetical protein